MLCFKYDFILRSSKCYLNFEKTNVNLRRKPDIDIETMSTIRRIYHRMKSSWLTKSRKRHVFERNRVKTSCRCLAVESVRIFDSVVEYQFYTEESVVIPHVSHWPTCNLRLHKRDFNEIRHRRDIVPFNWSTSSSSRAQRDYLLMLWRTG